jgi:hypothetical protein
MRQFRDCVCFGPRKEAGRDRFGLKYLARTFADKRVPHSISSLFPVYLGEFSLFLKGLWRDQLPSSFFDPVIATVRIASNHRNIHSNKLVE